MTRCAEPFQTKRSSASIITLGRRRCRTSCISVLPICSWSRSGTAITWRACRSRWPRQFDVAGRGAFYEEVGVIRDVIQNHLLQIVSYLAMEAPSPRWTAAIHAEQAKVLRTVRPLSPKEIVLGQYASYRRSGAWQSGLQGAHLRGVASVCRFVALERRAVPGARREMSGNHAHGGDGGAQTAAGQVVFNEPLPPHGNYVRFRLSPDVVIAIGARAKRPGEVHEGEHLELSVVEVPEQESGRIEAYERLLADAMEGDATLFARRGRRRGVLGHRRSGAALTDPSTSIARGSSGARSKPTGWSQRVGGWTPSPK